MTINKVLAFDALTCALMGIVLVLAAPALATLLALPHDLLFYAGYLLLPIAIFMAATAWRPVPAGVWLVILGNLAWVLASLVVLFAAGPNTWGAAFLVLQALVVALLGLTEFSVTLAARQHSPRPRSVSQ